MSDKFIITNHECEVCVLDISEETREMNDGNMLLFSLECNTEVDAHILVDELDTLVRALNEQDKALKEAGIQIP